MDQVKLTRKELYDLVWSQPMLSLSKIYAVSDVGLRKICIRMGIPLPNAGHWMKLKANKPVSIMNLSKDYSGEPRVTLFLRKEGDESNTDLQSPLTQLRKEIESDPNLPLVVPDRLTNPDKLIITAKETLAKQSPSHYGSDAGLVHCYRGTMSIRVSPDNIGRALRFMDTMIKLIRARGHEIRVEDNGTYVIIENEKLEISLREKTKRELTPSGISNWQTATYTPKGILSFRFNERAYRTTEWTDGKLPIEKQLAKIMAGLEIKAKELKEENLRIEKYWAEQREKERIQREIEQRKEMELSDFKELLADAHRWRQVKILRSYIDEVEAKATANNNSSTEFKDWLIWARKKIDWYDPYIASEDELLNDVNKESLVLKKKSTY